MCKPLIRAACFVASVVASSPVHAAAITFESTQIAGDRWEYAYTLKNNTLSEPIWDFLVTFDRALYSGLSVESAPADWDPLVLQPDPALPSDGFFDSLSLVAGLAPNGEVGGFLVSFDFLGAGTPGAQPFSVFDASFILLETGVTSLAAASTVPEPATVLLLLIGLSCLLLARVFHKRRMRKAAA
jgi:hypothetical protein